MIDLPTVALVIVAYHHADHLPATLAALDRLDYPAERLTTVVIDNGDGSSAEAARNWERSRAARQQIRAEARPAAPLLIIEPARNTGFAGGCNAGVAATQSDVVALINPDLEPRPDFLTRLVAPLHDVAVGVVGAKLFYPDGRTIQHAGGYLDPHTLLAQHHGYAQHDRELFNTQRTVEFVTGAALALRRQTWNALGGLDEAFYPAYYEDVDLGLRVAQMGLEVRYEPRAVAVHHEAAGLGKGSATYHTLFHTNRVRLLWKHRADQWLLHTWLPAELSHLRATADDHEIAALQAAYVHWQSIFLGKGAELNTPTVAQPSDVLPELPWTVGEVARKRLIAPLPFRSQLPGVARLRTWLSRIVLQDYARPLIQQQNDYNAAVAEAVQALERQRRATDAAIVCQGMLLAKLINHE